MHDLKLSEHLTPVTYETSLKLREKGYILKVGPKLELTDKGREIVQPFVDSFRALYTPGRRLALQ